MKGAILAVLVALLGLSVRWPEIGIRGSRPMRDLWQHCDLGAFADGFAADVPAHRRGARQSGRRDRGGDRYSPARRFAA